MRYILETKFSTWDVFGIALLAIVLTDDITLVGYALASLFIWMFVGNWMKKELEM